MKKASKLWVRVVRPTVQVLKQPKDLLEHVVVHEMPHLIEPSHSDGFIGQMSKCYLVWREAIAELNKLPLATPAWNKSGHC